MHVPRRRHVGIPVVALLLGLVTALTSCTGIRAAVAPSGQRPGIDVPTRPPMGTSRTPLGLPHLAPPGTGGYAFLATHPDGSPVAFDPCRQVHVVVRPDYEPAGGRSLLLSVLGELSAATGLEFVDDGSTDEPPSPTRAAYLPARYGDRWAPVLVAWSDPQTTPSLAGGVLGRAGPDAYGTGAAMRFVSGLAVFNAPELEAQLRTGDDAKARAVLLHELGHLIGLGHVSDMFQVMFDTNAYPLARYRAGDLRGLEQLGRGPCFDDR